ncbi:MAG: hypothetical protein SVU88_01455 [Candidatus Nanohaloarchaea archaeon]|nr:hypothetical protein [Candidatus Nanohaloarchaea archaeon]
MAKKRLPLRPDEEEHDDEPVVTPADEIRDDIDRAAQPGQSTPREEGRTTREQEQRPSTGAHQEEDEQGAQSGRRGRADMEDEAVRRLVRKLREKGKSDEWIERHMDDIRDRVRQELSG